MPIAKRWSRFTVYSLNVIPNVFGVYELADGKDIVIYIGSGKLHDRPCGQKDLTMWTETYTILTEKV